MRRHAWLNLALARGLHGHRLERLLRRFGTVRALLDADAREHGAAGLGAALSAKLRRPDSALQRAALSWLDAPGRRLLTWADDDYPRLLREIPDPPVALFLSGRSEALQIPQLAIVGSRNATPEGVANARRFARALGRAGLGITSGLARGIDAAAHRGALDEHGATVAVLGCGPDRIFPASHRSLAAEIAARGAVVSEYPPGTPAQAHQFPRRNRLISGLALGSLVVEAGTRSGALITARLAGEQGREVFALPGSIHNPLARGCHRLIRNGAKLVECVADIAEELPPLLGVVDRAIEQKPQSRPQRAPRGDTAACGRLLSSLGWEPVTADELVARSGLTAAEVSSILLRLELEDRVRPLAGGRYQQREEGVHDERDRA